MEISFLFQLVPWEQKLCYNKPKTSKGGQQKKLDIINFFNF